MNIRNIIVKLIGKAIQTLLKYDAPRAEIRKRVKEQSPNSTILLEYPVNNRPRYIKPHQELYRIIDQRRKSFEDMLGKFLSYEDSLIRIPAESTQTNPEQPAWANNFLPGLDAIALYCFLCIYNPKRYVEIGSGNSTRFARRAIRDHDLQTSIISIDPYPRCEIEEICDLSIRKPLDEVDVALFDDLEQGDILFVDNSHRVFMNSDATVVFLDILPRLKSGVLVEFHDIPLPYDYPEEWADRYYSEQYMLAAYLLGETKKFNILLANSFIGRDDELYKIISPLLETGEIARAIPYGGSFWIETN